MHYTNRVVSLAGLLLFVLATSTRATFSIVACQPEGERCGVAMATHNLAVGHGAPFARAGVGAGVSQFETNPCHARAVLSQLGEKATAAKAMAHALATERACADGMTNEARQLGVVSHDGTSAAFSGDQTNEYAAHIIQEGVVVLGNGLASRRVLDQMLGAFEQTNGELAERLLRALEAG